MEKNRKQFLDVARGLAIICIVLGHLGQGSINRVVFTFHVPIFFLISGYFISAESSVKEFLKKKIRTLIVPYGVFCLAVILSAVAFDLLLNHGRNALQLAAEWFFAALYGAGDSYTYPFTIRAIGALWFLLATFWGSVALRFLLERKAGTRLAAIAVIFALTKWSTRIFWFPLSIQAGGAALLYMYIGYLCKDLLPMFQRLHVETKAALLALMTWVWIAFMVNFQSFWLVHCDVGRGVVDILGSLCACGCVLFMSYGISCRWKTFTKAVAWLGQYSLLVLGMHIIELNTFPWDSLISRVYGGTSDMVLLLIKILLKFLWIVPMTVIFSRWGFTRKLLGFEKIRKETRRVHDH